MDGRSFDRIARILSASGSRRQALLAVFGSALAGAAPSVADAKAKRRNGGRARRRGGNRRLHAEAVPSRCCSSGNCTPGPGKNLSKCCYDGQNLTGKNFRGANLGGASFRGADLTNANLAGANLDKTCFVGADLTGAKLGGANTGTAIFCGTTMPDGVTINNSGCGTSTPCCPTCVDACPPDPRTNEPGFCCAGGFCSCGGVCCTRPDCFVISTQSRDSEQPPVEREVCEPPEGCAFCQGREDRCCTACVGPAEECASSGPISGGSIRRR